MTVNMNLSSSAVVDWFTHQALANYPNGQLNGDGAGSTSVTINFYMKRVTNQVETAASEISPHVTCFLQ